MAQLNWDDTFDLVLSNAGVDDIEFLRDLPLRELILNGNPVRDLSPLIGMKLRTLGLDKTNVGDLSPLRGMACCAPEWCSTSRATTNSRPDEARARS